MKNLIGLIMLLLSACAISPAANLPAAQTQIALANAYLEQNRLTSAYQSAWQATLDDPQLAAAWYTLAYCEERLGNSSAAERYYLQAIKISPKNGAVLNNFGVYWCRQHHYAQALYYLMLAAKAMWDSPINLAKNNLNACQKLVFTNKIPLNSTLH